MNCDIIIPVWNELKLTKDCIDNIIKNTQCVFRLIIIDNGSEVDVCDYLNNLKRDIADLTIIRNEENLGYVKAINQGLRVSSSEFVCLLNNDTIVGKDWLEEMINIASNNRDIGIVNPSSNTLAQPLPEGETVESFSESLKSLKGQWADVGQCSGFCMLIKRELIDKIGLLDEVYEVGYFEEIDYCRKAQKAGFQFARAKAAYVYHLDQQSFKKRSDKDLLFNKNRQIFEKRWGKTLRIVCVISKPSKDRIDKDEMEEIILTSARDNHLVYIYIKRKLVSLFDIPDYSNIFVSEFNDMFFYFICFFKIFTKKPRKRFNLVLLDDIVFYYILKIFTFRHKVKIMFSPHLERAIEASKKQALTN